MLQDIIDSANEVGVSTFITNSQNRIETQLNSLTKETDLPILLVSWDIDVSLNFNLNGFLDNPQASIVALLVSKPEDLEKESRETTAEEMGQLYTQFLQNLNQRLSKYQKQAQLPITDAGYTVVPKHGAGQHSGALGRFKMRIDIKNC